VGGQDYKYPYNPTDGRENLDAPDRVPHVLRGGSFFLHEVDVRCAARYRLGPYGRLRNVGFRVAVSPL
jgi:formylglycine-generating enzyme required for sulfatase activity